MRVTALALILALLVPAALLTSADASCCCKMAAGAACPMKRKASGCDEQGAKSCGMTQSEPAAAVTAPVGVRQPAVLVAVEPAVIPATEEPLIAPHMRVASRFLQPPEPPPPRAA